MDTLCGAFIAFIGAPFLIMAHSNGNCSSDTSHIFVHELLFVFAIYREIILVTKWKIYIYKKNINLNSDLVKVIGQGFVPVCFILLNIK